MDVFVFIPNKDLLNNNFLGKASTKQLLPSIVFSFPWIILCRMLTWKPCSPLHVEVRELKFASKKIKAITLNEILI